MSHHESPHPHSLLRLSQILGTRDRPGLLNIGRTKFYDMVKQNLIPKPLKLGRVSVWRYEDLQQALDRVLHQD